MCFFVRIEGTHIVVRRCWHTQLFPLCCGLHTWSICTIKKHFHKQGLFIMRRNRNNRNSSFRIHTICVTLIVFICLYITVNMSLNTIKMYLFGKDSCEICKRITGSIWLTWLLWNVTAYFYKLIGFLDSEASESCCLCALYLF